MTSTDQFMNLDDATRRARMNDATAALQRINDPTTPDDYNYALRSILLRLSRINDDFDFDLSDLDADLDPDELPFANPICADINAIILSPFHHDELSHLALQQSLCPMHFIDFAICFDDDDPTCSQIRTIYAHSHDT
jgi:hypothetical protein